MPKDKFNFREVAERIDAINNRLRELAAQLENNEEREDFTPAEKKERDSLLREKQIKEMQLAANTPNFHVRDNSDIDDVNAQMRDAVNQGQRFQVTIHQGAMRDTFGGNMSTYSADGLSGANPSGLTTGDIVGPLYAKNLLSVIGAPLLTGLTGNHQWPVLESFEASISGEAVQLGDTKIPLGKLIAKPDRIGIAVPITRQALIETNDLLRTCATQYMPVALSALMNKAMFSKEKLNNATNIVGPFVGMKSSKYFAGEFPTYAELNKLRSDVLESNVETDGMCYVMSETMKAELQSHARWNGAQDAIVDNNGKIAGVPVYTTSDVAQGTVLFGCFKYCPQAFFGDMSFIVDPYSEVKKGIINFVLEANYALTVLRPEAFGMIEKAGVSIVPKSLSIAKGAFGEVEAVVYPSDADITWTSANAKVTVTGNGKKATITAGSDAMAGDVVITAKVNVGGAEYTDTCTVRVASA